MQDSLEFGQTGMRQIKLDVKSATQQTDVYYVDCIKREKMEQFRICVFQA